MHFYMPPGSNAVDLMSDGETDRAVLDTLLTVLPEFDIHPFEARRESVGFIFNRIWAAIKRESLAVVAEGVARPEDVDGMFKLNWHMPVGPFQMMDQVGLDVVLDIENHYADENPHLPNGAAGVATHLRRRGQARRQDRRRLLQAPQALKPERTPRGAALHHGFLRVWRRLRPERSVSACVDPVAIHLTGLVARGRGCQHADEPKMSS